LGLHIELMFGTLVVSKCLNGVGRYNGPRWRMGGVSDEDPGGSSLIGQGGGQDLVIQYG
jgi:hypothetical protein